MSLYVGEETVVFAHRISAAENDSRKSGTAQETRVVDVWVCRAGTMSRMSTRGSAGGASLATSSGSNKPPFTT